MALSRFNVPAVAVILARILHRFAHVTVGREMHDHVDPMRSECVAQIGRPQQVTLYERPRHNRVAVPFAQVIQRHRMATLA